MEYLHTKDWTYLCHAFYLYIKDRVWWTSLAYSPWSRLSLEEEEQWPQSRGRGPHARSRGVSSPEHSVGPRTPPSPFPYSLSSTCTGKEKGRTPSLSTSHVPGPGCEENVYRSSLQMIIFGQKLPLRFWKHCHLQLLKWMRKHRWNVLLKVQLVVLPESVVCDIWPHVRWRQGPGCWWPDLEQCASSFVTWIL